MNQQFRTPLSGIKDGLHRTAGTSLFIAETPGCVLRKNRTTIAANPHSGSSLNVIPRFLRMPNILLLLAILFGLQTNGQVNLSNGLVAWYGLQGNASDNSGNLNTGTPTGGVSYVNDQWSAPASAVRLGGTANPGRISVPNSSTLQFTTGASFSCWFRLNSNVGTTGTGNITAGGSHCLFAKDGDAGGGLWCLVALNGTNLNFSIGNVGMTTMNYTHPGYTVGTWLHVAYVMDAGIQRLYINGTQATSITQASTFGTMNTKPFCMGRFTSGWYAMNGDIDECRIYNRAINNSEVSALSSTGTVSTTITDFSPASSCAGQSVTANFTTSGTPGPGNTFYLQLSDATGSFTNALTIGTLTSSATAGSITATIPAGVPSGTGYLLRINTDITPSTGPSSGPLTVNSIIGDMVSTSTYNYMGTSGGNYYFLSNAASTYATARTTSAANNGVIAGIHSATTNNFLRSFINSNTFLGYTDEVTEGVWVWEDGSQTVYTNWAPGEPNNASNQDYAQMLTNGQWDDVQVSASLRHFMMLRPARSNSPVCGGSPLNLIGPTISGATYAWSGPNGFTSTQQNPVIAAATLSDGGIYTLTITKGGCSESFTTTVIVTQAPNNIGQSAPLATTLSNGLILHYPMNGNATDNSGNSLNGTILGGVTATTDRFGNSGQALTFNGTNGYIDVPDGIYFTGSSFTASVWVRLNSYASWSRIFDFGNGPGSNNVLLSPTNGTTGRAACEVLIGAASGGQVTSAATQTGIGTWQHLVYTFENGTARLLLNGTVIAQGAQTAPQNVLRTICYIGRSNWGTDAYLNGALDDFRLYNRTLTSEELQSLSLYQPDNLGTIAVSQSFCSGTTTQLQLIHTQPGVSYQLRRVADLTTVGAAQIGTGDTLVFSTGAVTTTTAFEWVATGNVSGCSVVTSPAVTVQIYPIPAAPVPTNASVCNEGSMTISVSSNAGTVFNWYAAAAGGTPIVAITGNSYTTPVIDESIQYFVSVIDTNGCESPRSPVTATVINPLNPPVDIISGLILHYKFDGNLADSSGNGYNGTIFGTNSYVNDRNGNPVSAINSTASGDPGNNYISAGNPALVQQLTNQVTISMWIRQTQTWFDGGGQMPLVNKWNGSTGMWAGLSMWNPSNMQNRVRWRVNGSSFVESNTNVPVGEWHHIVCTYNGTQLRIYQNGVLTGTQNSGGIANTAVNLMLGRQANGTPIDGITYRGDWDEVKIYNRALNASEALTLYNNESVAFATTPLCDGEDNLTLSTFNFPGATYQWSGPNGFSSTVQNPPIIANADSATYNGLYTLLVTANGCTSPPQEVDVNIYQIPAAPVTFNDTVCGSGNAVLTASGAPVNGTYNWYTAAVGGSPINGVNGPTLTINNVTVTTERYVSISRFGCEGPRTLVTAVYQNPVNTAITATGSTVCGDATTATVTIPASENGVNYQAFLGAVPVSTVTAGGGSIILNINVASLNTGNNTLTIQAVKPGCGAVSLGIQPVITVNPLPNPTISADGPTAFCVGGSVNLTASSASGYMWSNGSTSASINVTTAGTYSVMVTDVNGCTGSSNTVTISTDPVPTVSITPSGPLTFCDGGNVTLTATGGNSYLWSNGSTNASIAVGQSGNYSVQVTSGSCTVSSNVVVVTVLPAPNATVTANGALTFCQGDSVVLSAAPATAYLWSNGQQTASITVTQSGSYSVTVTDNNGCSASSSPVNVTVNTIPTATITPGGSLEICSGNSITLTASGGNNYLWSDGSTGATLFVNQSGTFTVTAISNGCQAVSSPVTVVVNPLPQPTISANGPLTFCNGESVVLSATAADTYNWSNGASSQSVTITQSGTYSVTVTDVNGCSGTSSPATILVHAAPNANFSASGTGFCSGISSLQLTATDSGLTTYDWYKDGSAFSLNGTSTVIITEAGIYELEVTDANGCSAISALTIQQLTDPVAVITASAPTFCAGSSAVITANFEDDAFYEWLLDGNSIGAPQLENTIINATSGGNYSVVVTSPEGCVASSNSITLTENSLPAVTVSSSSTSFCAGGNVTLTATAQNVTYQWNLNGSMIAGANATTYPANQSGTYTVTVNDGACSATSAPVVITENTVPASPSSIAGSNVLCSGYSDVYSINPVNGATGYTWTITPAGAASIFQGQGTTAIQVNATNQNFTVAVIAQNACGTSGATSLAVSINTGFPCDGELLFAANETAICVGSQVTFTNYTNNAFYPGLTPQWNFGAGASPATASGNGPHNVTYSSAGLKTVTLSYVDQFGFVVVDEVRTDYISVAGSVTTSPIFGNATLPCNDQVTTYSVTNVAGSDFQWTVPAGAMILSGQGTNTIQVDFNGFDGQVSVVQTNQNGCVGAPVSMNVVIGNTVSTGPISGPVEVSCASGNETYTVPLTAGSTYQWTVPAGAVILSGQGTHTIQVDFNGNFGQMSVVETDDAGCEGDPQVITVDCVNGLNQLTDKLLQVSPNPFTTGITLSGDESMDQLHVQLYNEFGQLVFEEDVDWNQFIELSDLASGMYTGIATTSDNVYRFRVIKAPK